MEEICGKENVNLGKSNKNRKKRKHIINCCDAGRNTTIRTEQKLILTGEKIGLHMNKICTIANLSGQNIWIWHKKIFYH